MAKRKASSDETTHDQLKALQTPKDARPKHVKGKGKKGAKTAETKPSGLDTLVGSLAGADRSTLSKASERVGQIMTQLANDEKQARHDVLEEDKQDIERRIRERADAARATREASGEPVKGDDVLPWVEPFPEAILDERGKDTVLVRAIPTQDIRVNGTLLKAGTVAVMPASVAHAHANALSAPHI